MKTIHIRIYKAKQGVTGLGFDGEGKVLNENHLVKLPHDTMEWHNYLKTLKPNGIIKVDVVGFYKSTDSDGKFVYEGETKEVEAAIHTALHGAKDAPLSKDEEIALLKKQMAELMGKKDKPVKEKAPEKAPAKTESPDKTPDVNEELESAKRKYQELFGKKPHHTKSLEILNREIESETNK